MKATHSPGTQLEPGPYAQLGDTYPLWSVLDSSSACIGQLDLQLRLTGGNASFADVFGQSVDALAGLALADLVHPSVREKVTRRLLSLARGERGRFTDWVVPYAGAMSTSRELTGIAVTNEADHVDSLIVVVQQERATSAAPAARTTR